MTSQKSKTPVGETGCLCITFFLAQPPLASSLALPWTIARLLDLFYTFSPAHPAIHNFTPAPFECIGIQFCNLLTCDLQETMLRQRSPTLIPREAEDFPRGNRHCKHAPPPTYLICLSPKGQYWQVLFKAQLCHDL